MNRQCQCVTEHSPTAYVTNQHHIVPQSWGGQTVATNLIPICPNTHTAVHELMNAYVHAGGLPPWEIRQHYSTFVRDLAAYAWARRPNDHPPYTVGHPTGADHG